MKKLNCLFFATPSIANDTLESLAKNESINLLLVVSMPDRKSGRGKLLKSPDIITKARELKLDYLQCENINKSEKFSIWSNNQSIDLIVVFAFAQFLGSKILSLPKHGCFNIHTSLLPKYRGAAPMQYSLFNGDKVGGISIQKMVKKMDAGNIVKKNEIEISLDDNLGSLHDKYQKAAPSLIAQVIGDILTGNITEVIQNEELVSFAPSIPKSQTLLDFVNSSATSLHNKVRGLCPIPSAYCFINNKRVKVFKTELSSVKLSIGETSVDFGTLLIGTIDGTLRLCEVQLEGKSRGSDFDLINGFKNSNSIITISSTLDSK